MSCSWESQPPLSSARLLDLAWHCNGSCFNTACFSLSWPTGSGVLPSPSAFKSEVGFVDLLCFPGCVCPRPISGVDPACPLGSQGSFKRRRRSSPPAPDPSAEAFLCRRDQQSALPPCGGGNGKPKTAQVSPGSPRAVRMGVQSELRAPELIVLSLGVVFGHTRGHPGEAEFGRQRLLLQSWVIKRSGSLEETFSWFFEGKRRFGVGSEDSVALCSSWWLRSLLFCACWWLVLGHGLGGRSSGCLRTTRAIDPVLLCFSEP